MNTLDLSVVVIGRNEGARLERCLKSIFQMDSCGFSFEVIYVDSASTDGSVELAQSMGAKVVAVTPARPTAALGRNAGWKVGLGSLVLFLDGDTILDPEFVVKSLPLFDHGKVAVVWGHRREINTRASFYNLVLDLDWISPPGYIDYCGGDALMRRDVLEQVNGYDERLIAGEEPEMCWRIRNAGYKIFHSDCYMTGHDLAMTSWHQYWHRATRTGYAYAEVSERFCESTMPLWHKEAKGNQVRASALMLIAAAGILLPFLVRSVWPFFLVAAFFLLLILRSAWKVRWKSKDPKTGLLYGVHSHLQQIPIFFGQLQYRKDRKAGRKRGLIEYKGAAPERSSQQMRVLLSAYQCGPGLGSVSQIGWEWYSRLSSRIPVTLVTHVRNRPALEAKGAPLPTSDIIFVDTEWFAKPLYQLANALFPKSQHAVFLLSSLDFYLYDFMALRLLRKQKGTRWSVVHAVTPVSPLAATRLFKLGHPLILGPWNGGMTFPSAFRQIMREDSGWLYRIRDVGKMVDGVIGSTQHASAILSATAVTDQSIPPKSRMHVRRMIENGVDLTTFYPDSRTSPRTAEPLRILFVGRLVPFKGVRMLLEAMCRVREEFELHATIVGDGPLRQDIEGEVGIRNLGTMVTLTGNLPLADVAKHMRECHIFCLPSIRESGGAVVLEAMACSAPVVAVNYGGPAEIVDDQVGRLLSAEGPEELISDLVSALRDAVRDPIGWRERGLQGQKRAKALYGWDAKIDTAVNLYSEVLADQQRSLNGR